jgi:hypothetical protein
VLQPGLPSTLFYVLRLEALHFAKLSTVATEVRRLPGLSTCPAVRYPQPGPGRRVREASSPPTYYAWMQTGRAYSVFPSGRSRLQAGPRRRLPAPKGCPGRLGSRATRPGTVRSGLRKHCWSLGVSQRLPAEDRRELRGEAGNNTNAVRLGAGARLWPASLPGWLKRQLPAHTGGAAAKAHAASGT